MVLLVYRRGMNMVLMGQVQGRLMIDICHDAIEANNMEEMPNKGFGFGDRIFELYQQLETTEVMLMGPHHIVEQHAMGVPTEMEEFYDLFRNINEWTKLILLPTTMPTGVFGLAFKFKQDPTEAVGDDNGVAALHQNLGDILCHSQGRWTSRSQRPSSWISGIPR